MNLKLALKKRWIELVITLVWLTSGIIWTVRADDVAGWVIAICAYGCAVCWLFIFYKRAKRDGC